MFPLPKRYDARSKKNARPSFTLLEVILALALSTLVLAAIGFAINSHLKFFEAGRSGVEEAQIARAILSRIADDLRNTVPYWSSQTDAGSSGSGSSTASGSTASPTSSESDEDLPETDADATESTPATTVESDDLSAAAPQAAPGLYGNAEQLELDISRLPRRDQLYWSLHAAEELPSLEKPLSDVKNVVYYVLHGETTAMAAQTFSATPASGQGPGLYRRELDRAVALYAAQQGGQATLDQAAELMASEVEALEFHYFDGQEWLDYWDSSSLEGLPAAVEIRLKLARRPATSRQLPTSVIYRLIVHLPVTQSLTQTATESTESSTESAPDSGGR